MEVSNFLSLNWHNIDNIMTLRMGFMPEIIVISISYAKTVTVKFSDTT